MSSRSMREIGEVRLNGIVRRVVSLPRNIIGGVSRIVNQGRDLIGFGRTGRSYHHHSQISHSQQPFSQPFQDPAWISVEWAFLVTFEQQYGTVHPFFYSCRFADALKMARDERKFVFMYVHSPEHRFTPNFCRETLCSELVVQFLDANFICWGGLASQGDGLHMVTALRASSFPLCTVMAPTTGDNLAVVQQMEGPVSPAELVEILQRTMEEQGPAFGIDLANEEEKRRADRRLREEQDAAYLAALCIDQENERLKKNSSPKDRVPKTESTAINYPNKAKLKAVAAETSYKMDKNAEVTQILIRFPNGERREHAFRSTDTIQAIYGYIDSIPGVGSYRLISNFPRKVYGADQMGINLKEAGLHPKASLFLEPQ